MTIILCLIAGLFCIKIIWNLGVPYVLLSRPLDTKTGRSSGISMATSVELFFLVLAVGLSALATGDTWLHSPLKVAFYGVLAIIGSYIHLVIVGIIGGWIVSRSKREK